VIAHPAIEPAVIEAGPEPVAAEIAAAPEPEAPVQYEPPAVDYEPDQERRDKFLSRFSRWAKKG
jgi:hypothetical protein